MSLVVFAVLRIVTALFIKETLSTAAQDAELVIEDSRRCALQYQRKLEENGQFMVPKAIISQKWAVEPQRLQLQELFKLVDDDSDGHLTAEEFVQAMRLPSVDMYLKYLERLSPETRVLSHGISRNQTFFCTFPAGSGRNRPTLSQEPGSKQRLEDHGARLRTPLRHLGGRRWAHHHQRVLQGRDAAQRPGEGTGYRAPWRSFHLPTFSESEDRSTYRYYLIFILQYY